MLDICHWPPRTSLDIALDDETHLALTHDTDTPGFAAAAREIGFVAAGELAVKGSSGGEIPIIMTLYAVACSYDLPESTLIPFMIGATQSALIASGHDVELTLP